MVPPAQRLSSAAMSEITLHLIDAARDGDTRALTELYARHEGRLLAFIRATMSSAVAMRLQPEDVLQETLLESARKLDDFEDQGRGSFYRWLVGIARNKLKEAARAGRARKRSLEQPYDGTLPGAATSPSAHAAAGERDEGLHLVLAELPERQGEAVRLRYLEGRSTAEVAEQLGCSEGAVKSLVSRGLAELGRRLEG